MLDLPPATSADRPAASQNRTRLEQPDPRVGTVRRVVSLQNDWSNGPGQPVELTGQVQDLYTCVGGGQRKLAGDWVRAHVDGAKRIVDLDASRRGDVLAGFAGLSTGGALRKAKADHLPEEVTGGTGLNSLIDELAGASFMSGSAWYAWPGGIEEFARQNGIASVLDRSVADVCLSYVAGSPAVRPDGSGNEDIAHHPLATSILMTSDIWADHGLKTDVPNHWRLRRTDLWQEGGALFVDAWFQDSSSVPGMTDRRLVFHEYSLQAMLEPTSLALQAIDVVPHVLPYTTCRAAPATVAPLIGRSARDLRAIVLELLRGPAGCTHLNDMLRSLQDLEGLEGQRAAAQNG